MKILNFDDFIKLPSGILYMECEPCVFGNLLIKGATYPDHTYPDYLETNFVEIKQETFDIKENIELDFTLNSFGRNGIAKYDKTQVYAVLEKHDVQGLIKILTTLEEDYCEIS